MIYALGYIAVGGCYALAVYRHYGMGGVAANRVTAFTIYAAMFVGEGLMWPVALLVDLFRMTMNVRDTPPPIEEEG